MELAGHHLLFTLMLRGEQVFTAAALLDGVTAPQTLLRCSDTEAGWVTTGRLITAMERHEIKSLTRPIEVGTPGDPDVWVIG